jgi:pyruvate formate-lyase/glycerol dehydratase family glycyl radical enzyme
MTEGESEIIRRAKALQHMLENMTIYLQEGELIVGNNTPGPELLYLSPEISSQLMQEAIEDGYISGNGEKDALEIMSWWKGKTLRERVEAELTPEELLVIDTGATAISITHKDGAQHCVPNWEYVYSHGLEKIMDAIRNELDSVNSELSMFNGPGLSEKLKERHFLTAMLISCDAVLAWTERYACLAEEQASEKRNPERKMELERIASIFHRLLRKEPASFHEALQGFFTLHIILNYIDRAGFGSLSRIDQIWWPYYKKDVIDEKNITRDEAIECIEALWIKMLDLGYWFPRERRHHFEGNSLLQTLTLAGVDVNGDDACNELTSAILDATRNVRTNQPTLNFRYHPSVSQKALDSALEVVRSGMGMPAFLNDRVLIDSLLDQGVPIREARNWGVVGCVSACPVNMQITTKRLAQSNITAKCFELALNNGICMLTGKRLGPATGDAAQFTFDELVEAFRLQVEYAFRLGVKVRNITRNYEMEILQRPLASALHRSPLQRRQDVSEYEDAPNLWINCVGIVDVVDSLQVIRQLAFTDRKVSFGDLITAIRNNWEDEESLRLVCINKVAKFGNGDDEVDRLAARVFRLVAEEARKVKDINGGTYRILPQSVSLYVSTGKKVAALPSGRKAYDFLSDGGISPAHGMDHNGPTAVLNSASKVDHGLTKGILLNQRFHPDTLAGEAGKQRFKAYLKAWYNLGLSQIQLNVVSTGTLKEAQKAPERYGDLIVRVAGYSAYYTELNDDVQNAIISRMEQQLV